MDIKRALPRGCQWQVNPKPFAAPSTPASLPSMAWSRNSIRWMPNGTLVKPTSKARPRWGGRPSPNTMTIRLIPEGISTALP